MGLAADGTSHKNILGAVLCHSDGGCRETLAKPLPSSKMGFAEHVIQCPTFTPNAEYP